MQRFALYLSNYLSRKRISYKRAAELTGIDRTQLKRYVIGERLPKDKLVIEELSKGIGMSEEEAEELFLAYKISIVGEKKYRAYQYFKRIYSGEISDCTLDKVIDDDIRDDDFEQREMISINDKERVFEVIKYLCDVSDNLRFIFNNKLFYDFIHNILKNDISCRSAKSVEEIICLNGSFDKDDISDIENFEMIYPNLISETAYRVYCSYDSCLNKKAKNYLFTDKGMLTFHELEADAKRIVGIYTTNRDVISYYEKEYEEIKNNCYLYCTNIIESETIHHRDGICFENSHFVRYGR